MITLESLILNDPQTEKANPAFVSVYSHGQCYGGPEEGGWWYDVVKLVGSRRFPHREEAEAYLEQQKAEVERRNKEAAPARARAYASLPDCDEEPLPDAGEGYIPAGWSDGGKLFVQIEEVRGQADNSNEPRPHYE